MDEEKRARLERAITPQGDEGRPSRKVSRKPVTAPDWRYWPAERVVEVWQAIALSLDIDPDSLELSTTGSIKTFRSADERREFLRRIKMIAALTDYASSLPLSEYSVMLGALPMPEQLAALAPDMEPAAPVQASPAHPKANVDAESALEPSDPPYLTTADLLGCFGGHMGVENPAKVLSEYPDWATKNGALVQRGKRGRSTKENPNVSAWNPVQFALNLLCKKPLPRLSGIGNLKQEHLDTVFGMKSLAKWKPIWATSKPL